MKKHCNHRPISSALQTSWMRSSQNVCAGSISLFMELKNCWFCLPSEPTATGLWGLQDDIIPIAHSPLLFTLIQHHRPKQEQSVPFQQLSGHFPLYRYTHFSWLQSALGLFMDIDCCYKWRIFNSTPNLFIGPYFHGCSGWCIECNRMCFRHSQQHRLAHD